MPLAVCANQSLGQDGACIGAWHSSGSKMPPVDAAEACLHYQWFCAYVDVFCLNRCCGSIIAVLHVLPGAVTGHSEGYMTRWIYIRSSSHMVSLSIIGTKTLPFHSASCNILRNRQHSIMLNIPCASYWPVALCNMKGAIYGTQISCIPNMWSVCSTFHLLLHWITNSTHTSCDLSL